MWLIFDHLWVTTSTESIKSSLATTVRQIASLTLSRIDTHAVQTQRLDEETRTIVRGFDKIRANFLVVLGVVDRGAMSTYYRRQDHILPKGTVLLLNAGEVHVPAPAAGQGWSFRMFYFPTTFLEAISPEDALSDLHFEKPFVRNASLADLLVRLHTAMEEPADRLELQSALSSVFCGTYAAYTSEPFTQTVKPDRSSMEMALQYLHENFYLNPTLEELANLSPFGPSHFLRRFQATVGLTPHAYLLQLRVERAMSLLRSRMPIVEIADSLGFVDQSHFTKIFKRVLGITPRQFATDIR